MSGTSLAALMLAGLIPGEARADCSVTGTTQNCSGFLENGVVAGAGVTALNVGSLTNDIGRYGHIDGISFTTTGAATLVSNTGSYKINVWASDADGIVVTTTGNATVSVNHTGNIETSAGYGIIESSGGDIVSTSSGFINSAKGAIQAYAGGAVTLQHTGNLNTASGIGVDVEGGDDVSVTTSGTITSKFEGIKVSTDGSGASATVTHTGSITSAVAGGIDVSADDGPVSVTTSGGSIQAKHDAISAVSDGDTTADTVTVTNGNTLLSWEGRGIDASAANGAVTVTSGTATNASIVSRSDGIRAVSNGTTSDALVTVDYKGDIQAYAETGDDSAKAYGVYATSKGGSISVTTTGNIGAETDGIRAFATAADADVTVNHTGNIQTNDGRGIYATAADGPVSVTVNGTINSKTEGVFAVSSGPSVDDGVTVNVGSAISADAEGVFAKSENGAVTVTSTGTIEGKTEGVHAVTYGTDSSAGVTVSVNNATGWDGRGIYAVSPQGAVSVTSTGKVTGGTDGIYAVANGDDESASVTVSAGSIQASNGYGVYATSKNGAVSVSATGNITATHELGEDGDGIYAVAPEAAVTVDVKNVSGQNYGIYAVTDGDELEDSVTVTAGNVTGWDAGGIYATSENGAVSVTAGNVVGQTDGIYAVTDSIDSSAGVTVSAGAVTGWDGYGIYATAPQGAVSVTATGAVVGKKDGIYAVTDSVDSDNGVTVSADDVTSWDGRGIYATAPQGAVSVTSTGTVIGKTWGIYAYAPGVDGTIASVTVSANNVTGWDERGIYAVSENGAVSVTSTGAVEAGKEGIYAVANGAGSEATVTVDAHDVTSKDNRGIYADSANHAISVTSDGAVVAKKEGIYASAKGAGTDATVYIDAHDVSSVDEEGIYAVSENGKVTVKSDGKVSSDSKEAIYAVAKGTDDSATVTVNAHDVESKVDKGIYANSVNHSITVTSDGAVVAKLEGIYAWAKGAGTDATVTVEAHDVSSEDEEGIYAVSENGQVTVKSDGKVSSDSKEAIYAVAKGTDDSATVTVNAHDVESKVDRGIYANSVNHSITVTSDGAITAKLEGIYAVAHGAGTDATVDIEAHDVSSEDEVAIYATSDNGAVTVGSDGKVSSDTKEGIYAVAKGTDASATVTVNAHDVEAMNDRGIYANSVNHSITVTSDGAITAKLEGIYAWAQGAGTDATVDIEAHDVSSEDEEGIYAVSENGKVTVGSDGKVSSDSKEGIYAVAKGTDASATVTVNAHDVESKLDRGIYANSVNHSITVTSDGAVVAELEGIYAVAAGAGSDATVTIEAHDVTSNTKEAIFASSANGAVSVSSDGKVTTTAAKTGIYAVSTGSDASATVSVTAKDIESGGRGIYATASYRGVTVTSTGSIVAEEEGIFAIATHATNTDATVTVEAHDVTSNSEEGIYATSVAGAVSVTSDGKVTAEKDGIFATTTGDDASATVSVTAKDIEAGGRGVYATASYRGVTVTSTGSIVAEEEGIFAIATHATNTDATVTVEAHDVTSNGDRGIYATSVAGAVSVTSDGKVTAEKDGIFATTTGDDASATVSVTAKDIEAGERGVYATASYRGVTVTSTGSIVAEEEGIYAAATHASNTDATVTVEAHDVTSNGEEGIYATSVAGAVSVTSDGKVTAEKDGIYATTTGDDASATVSVTAKDIDAEGRGIYATSSKGDVDVTVTGDITSGSYGIFAKSGDGGAVTVDVTGDVTATANAAVYAEGNDTPVSVTTDGDITGETYGIEVKAVDTGADVTVDGGTVKSNTNAAAIRIATGDGATITNAGTIDGGTGYAIQTVNSGLGSVPTVGSETTITNNGTISGNIDLFSAYSEIFNTADGTLNAGSDISFYDGSGKLQNAGMLSVGAVGTIFTTHLDGDFEQTAGGEMLVDINVATGLADKLTVSGDADVDGTIALKFLDIHGVVPSTYTLITSAGLGVTSLDLANVALNGTIDYVDGKDVVLTLNGFNFTGGQSEPWSEVGEMFNTLLASDDRTLDPILYALLDITDVPEYVDALKQLAPDLSSQTASTAVTSNLNFANRLLSCRVRDGVYAFNAEGECSWSSMQMTFTDRQATSQNSGYDQTAFKVSGGVQRAISDDWRLGLAVGYTNTSSNGDYGTSTDSDQAEAGVVLKYDHEALTIATSLTGGYGWYDNRRKVAIGGFTDELSGDNGIALASGRVRTAYTFAKDGLYVRPMADVDLTWIGFGGYTEKGGIAALSYEDTNHWVVTVTPGVEFGGEWKAADGVIFRPYVDAGVSFIGGSDIDIQARFAAVDPSLGTFAITSYGDDVLGRVNAGLDILTTSSSALRFYYEGSFGKTIEQHTAGAKFAVPF
ncbi:hypothetical protein [Prosthecomicrobium pneumaticum]|uniref:Autotransporter domain-containing protein n=1 Tax=Prosthecomicrobium pneumaticum TaxID=81895 RepID=A0A7W9CTJ3_9HYPH|nr:hypothetical protein [Prosthecomicrobium pneumaticum]MBB5751369.1 hypothetical protein [Prosthecomicrobium pneumaticum]